MKSRKKGYQEYKWGTVRDKKGNKVNVEKTDARVKYIRNGGHLSAGDIRLHEFVYYKGVVSSVGKINRRNERIHHKGHSFDNRLEYIMRVGIAEHKYIHNKWEKSNGYYRPKEVELWHEDIKNIGVNNNIGILHIKSKMQLNQFKQEIDSQDYLKLKGIRHYK